MYTLLVPKHFQGHAEVLCLGRSGIHMTSEDFKMYYCDIVAMFVLLIDLFIISRCFKIIYVNIKIIAQRFTRKKYFKSHV